MNKHIITTSANDITVYVDLVRSDVSNRISRQPHLLALVKEVLQSMKLTKPEMCIESNMGRTIGNTEIVETSESDVVMYAQRLHYDTYTRFVKNGKASASQYITILLHRDEDGEYELINTWVGRSAPPFPGEKGENVQSKKYWAEHAVIFDGQPLKNRTLTKECPY